MDKYKILGYSNPLDFNCAPVITIIQQEDKIGAIFPDLSMNLVNIETIDSLQNFTREMSDKFIFLNQYSYLSYSGEFHTKNENEILEIMNNDLQILNDNDFQKEMLEELVVSEYIRLNKEINQKVNLKYIKLFATTRIKGNGEKAKRIILQHFKNGSYKTDYKKNFYSNDIHSDFDNKRLNKTLKGTLYNLSVRYKDESILKLNIKNIA
ncbi:MAG: hypothetical protein QM751_09615 [Paludibacteraceae bacterium]